MWCRYGAEERPPEHYDLESTGSGLTVTNFKHSVFYEKKIN